MRRAMWFGVLAAGVLAMAGCGPKGKSCADVQAKLKPGMSEEEIEAALGKWDESGRGLGGDYINYKCDAEGDMIALHMRDGKIGEVQKVNAVKPGRPDMPAGKGGN